jgi:hypothetical protein
MGRFQSTDEHGQNGAFSIPLPGHGHQVIANCIVSDGSGVAEIGGPVWEHVSLHIVEYGKERTPTWIEMCQVKDIFWDEEEEVVQFHPKKSQYVNCHPHVLHLWRRPEGFPTPPRIFV